MKKTEPSSAWSRALGLTLCGLGLAVGVGTGLLVRRLRADPLADRRLEVDRMSPSAKQHLLRQQQRFDKLNEREQDNLRALQAEVAAAPEKEKLTATMEAYNEWLKTLSITQRGDLLELAGDPKARLAKVDEFQREQDRRQPLQREDAEVVMKWLERVRGKLPEDIQERIEFPFVARSPRQGDEDPENVAREQRRRLVWFAYYRWMSPSYRAVPADSKEPRETLPVDANDLSELGKQLSPTARKRLANAMTLSDKLKLLGGWMRSIIYRRWRGGAENMLPEVSKTELVRFFENELTEQQREDLLRLDSDELDQRLRFMYLRASLRSTRPLATAAAAA